MQAAKTSKRIARFALAALMVVAAALALPGRAHADDLDGVPRTITGTCYIGETWMVGDQSFFAIPSFSGGLSGAVPSTTFECLDHTAAAPEYTDADYTAELCDYSVSEGWVEYYVTIIPPDVTDGYTSNEYGLIGYQRVGGKVRIPHEFNGELNLVKSSARPSVTDGNPCYSLEGAVYEVFSSRGADGSLFGKVGELTTDASGHTNTLTLSAGVYFVKEKTPPAGYLVDGDNHQATVAAGATTTVEVSDQPANDPTGALVQKVDAITGKNVPVGDASLAGAEITFRYYAGYYGGEGQPSIPAQADRTWVMRTDSNGLVNIVYDESFLVSGDSFYVNDQGAHILPLGTITAIETKAPEGYLIGSPTLFITQIKYNASSLNGVDRVKVNYEGVATTGNIADAAKIDEQPQRGNVELVKRDPETADGSAQGDATLAGAVFDIVNESANPVVSPQTGAEVANGGVVCQIVTDAEGFASTTRADLNGWSIPDGWDGKALDFGTYTIRESKAPEGYDLNAEWSETAVIDSDGKTVSFNLTDDVIRGGVAIGKVDRGNGGYLPEGAATLAGATFSVYNIGDADVVVDGVQYAPGKVVATIVTVEDNGRYIASTSIDALPYSSYELRESGTSAGYLLDYDSRTWRKQFQVRAHEIVDLTDESDAVANQVIRGDIFLNKVHEFTMARLPGIPFKATSKTTGEWHVIVTDENGQVSTASDWNSHLAKTNANDEALGSDGRIDESKLDSRAGVWFHGRTDAESAISDELGALPFDTYVLTELQCEANKGLTPVEFEVTVSRDGRELDLGTVDDHEAPSLGTELTGPDGIHVVPAYEDAVLVDTVSFKELPSGSYTMEGELHLVGADGSDGGVVATASKGFVASTSSGTVEMSFRVDASSLGGGSLVAFERAVSDDGSVVASHEDLSDEGQTVTVPQIGTTLTDAADGDHEAASTGPVKLVDTVAYEGLQPDKTYTMTAVLHLKGDGGEDLGAAKDAHGDPITSQQQFTPTEPSGTVEVTFTFAPDKSSGATVVAFEELRYGERTYAAHAEISDEAQSADIPWIGTTASDSETGSHTAHLGGSVSIVDVVAYEKLQVGVEYELTGTLHSRDADGRDSGVVTGKDGKPVTAEKTFTPEKASGSVSLTFEVDGSLLAGKTVVAFESVSVEGVEVAAHAVITDEGQSVHIPTGLQTTAISSDTETQTMPLGDKAVIVDTVAYWNLVPGETYELSGTVHVRGADGSDQGALEQGDAIVSSSVRFMPETPDGLVEAWFEVDTAGLEGSALVVFEELSSADGSHIASHADISDEGQTVKVPSIGTTATDKASGNHGGVAASSVTIVDEIAYEGLEPGRSYRAEGVLYDKGTGKPYLVKGKEVSGTAEFTAEASSGKASVAFEFDGSALAGAQLVAFERVYDADGSLVAVHEDIDDEGQTVSYRSPDSSIVTKVTQDALKFYDRTADWLLGHWPVLLAVVALIGSGAFLLVRRRGRDGKSGEVPPAE